MNGDEWLFGRNRRDSNVGFQRSWSARYAREEAGGVDPLLRACGKPFKFRYNPLRSSRACTRALARRARGMGFERSARRRVDGISIGTIECIVVLGFARTIKSIV